MGENVKKYESFQNDFHKTLIKQIKSRTKMQHNCNIKHLTSIYGRGYT